MKETLVGKWGSERRKGRQPRISMLSSKFPHCRPLELNPTDTSGRWYRDAPEGWGDWDSYTPTPFSHWLRAAGQGAVSIVGLSWLPGGPAKELWCKIKFLDKEKQVKTVGIQTVREVRARVSGQGITRLSYRLSGAWFYVDALVLSKEHSGPGTVRTLLSLPI